MAGQEMSPVWERRVRVTLRWRARGNDVLSELGIQPDVGDQLE